MNDNVAIVLSPAGMQVFPLGDAFDTKLEAVIAELRKTFGHDKVTVHRFVGDFEIREPLLMHKIGATRRQNE